MTGQEAVTKVLAEILAERNPGTVWLPVEGDQAVGTNAPSGQIIRRLSAPQNERPVADGGEARAA